MSRVTSPSLFSQRMKLFIISNTRFFDTGCSMKGASRLGTCNMSYFVNMAWIDKYTMAPKHKTFLENQHRVGGVPGSE